MSIHKLKIFDFSALKPLSLIFINCCLSGIFSVIWKMSNIVLIHKKSDKLKINMSLSTSDKHAEAVDKCEIKILKNQVCSDFSQIKCIVHYYQHLCVLVLLPV